ncbi:hypothetical protein GW866_02095 [bacterium]|nr:hypothetical protein [bacterium]OIO86544.1 MAG: hypothetical protein AUK02_05830 [Anaerolineae bacterium CG2_30_58_95]PIU91557.1 MAG: hypothetical protein COS63_00870 [Anaerolineae bacterium CG06_land_8_20_14_3_00_57_67]PIW20144.1 MAG: hypothetical protein COW33_03280 [Anaerolineae bacterium CG17_big_fil_post_rev_8_21_14_2_50_57_27]PIZ25723.1 MAG: hypothetical protein COY47_04385 [Chloroflexi bacterium CG_4_10_14_0_8_um_filter_57_5]PJH74770.1 MAG: hypothetical protein CO064_10255 [Anaerolin
MSKGKTSISNARSYKEIGEFWDSHEIADYWDQTYAVDAEFDIRSEVMFYSLDADLSARLHSIARRRGVSPETLLNLWVQEKLQSEISS